MTSTSVKDVSTVMKSYVSNVGNAGGNSAKTSFQEVWNNQTGKNTASDANADTSAVENKKPSDGVDSMQRRDNLKARDAARAEGKDAAQAESAKAENTDEKKLEEAMEMLGTAAVELMQEIADAFGMSAEELEQLMTDMNMDTVDLLEPGKLSALLLEAGGAADSLALLTDEGLCNNFQMLMNRQKEMFAQLSEALQMTPEQLTQFIEEMTEFQADADEMLMNIDVVDEQSLKITVEVESAEQPETENLGQEPGVVTKEAVTQTESSVMNKTAQDGKGEQHSENAKDQTGNLMLQNLKNETFHPQLQQVSESTSAWSESTQNIMRQIMDFMKIQVKADTSSLEMQLHPESLGTLQVQVASKGGVLTANFITENETVKAVLESQMIQLKESFAEQGVKVDAIEVTVQTHQFESNLEQGRGRQQEESQRKGRTRRINLNAPLDMEDAEPLTGEEQLAAEMMTANGNTVDYTA